MKSKFSLFILAIVVISGALFQSCKKERTETNMVVRNWSLQSKVVGGDDIADNCEQTSKWNFKADNTYVITDSCSNVKTGTWELREDGKTLSLDNNEYYSVIENSMLTLVIEMQVNGTGLVRWTFN